MCRSMCIILALFVGCLSNAHAEYGSDNDDLNTVFKSKIQQLERKFEEEKAKTNEIIRSLESKLDVLEKREQHNYRSKRQVVGTVAFSAYLNHDVTNLGPDQTIQFQGVVINEGNAYNNQTGVFTVPVNGVYFLTFTAEDFRPHAEWLKLVVDGQVYSSTAFGSFGNVNMGHFVGSNIVLARLGKGQSVRVATDTRATPGGSLHGDESGRFTTFSGFYLYE